MTVLAGIGDGMGADSRIGGMGSPYSYGGIIGCDREVGGIESEMCVAVDYAAAET